MTEAEIDAPHIPEAPPEVIRIAGAAAHGIGQNPWHLTSYVQHAFSEKQRGQMEETQRAGQQARGKKVRQPKDFEGNYRAAMHISSQDGWACAFRCRLSATP